MHHIAVFVAGYILATGIVNHGLGYLGLGPTVKNGAILPLAGGLAQLYEQEAGSNLTRKENKRRA
jgi:hypothetical protein